MANEVHEKAHTGSGVDNPGLLSSSLSDSGSKARVLGLQWALSKGGRRLGFSLGKSRTNARPIPGFVYVRACVCGVPCSSVPCSFGN